MEGQSNAAPLDLVTGVMNLPGITVTAGTPQQQLYEAEETILDAYLEFRNAADALSTDAQITADAATIEAWDGDTQIFGPLTPAECQALYNHYHTKDVAYAANSGIVPLPIMPDDFPLSLTRSHFGLGRLADDGSGISKFKIIVTWSAVVATVVACTPIIVFDPSEKRARMGRHYRVRRHTYTEAGTLERRVESMFRDSNAIACKELLVNTAVGTFTNCTVKQGTELRYYQTRPPVLNRLQHKAGLTAIAGRQSILFNTLNDHSSRLQLRGKAPAELTINWSVAPGASDILALMEYDGRVTW